MNFRDLQHGSMIDKTIYNTVTSLLTDIFGRDSGEFVFDLPLHTDANKKKIIDNWMLIKKMFNLDSKIKSQDKVITQTFKCIALYLNDIYNFDQPIDIKKYVKSITNSITKTHTNINQTIIFF